MTIYWKNKILILTLFSLPLFSSAQVDSLTQVFENSNLHDTIRFNAVSQIFKEFIFTNPDSAAHYANNHYNLAVKKDLPLQTSIAFHNHGLVYHVKGDLDSAEVYYLKSVKIGKTLDNSPIISGTFNNLALISKNNGNYQKALDYFIEVQILDEKNGNISGMASTYNNIALIYEDLQSLDKALAYHSKSLNIAEDIKDTVAIARSKNNIGIINKDLGQNREAILKFNSCIVLNKKTKQYRALAQAYNNLGLCYNNLLIIDSALINFNYAYELMDSIQYNYGKSFVTSNIGSAYVLDKKPKQALPYLLKALNEAEELNNILLQSNTNLELSKTYEQLNKKAKAYDYLSKYFLLKDSLQSSDNEQALLEQQYKLDYIKKTLKDSLEKEQFEKVKNTELALANANSEKFQLETNFLNRQKWFLYSGLILIAIFGIYIFNRFKKSQIQKRIIENQKKQVDLAFDQLEEKNTEIMDSITYAKRIQSAILPPDKLVKELLKNSFILYKPKDIVAGDFYWLEQKNGFLLFAAADCTGHGVPGALVSVICNNGLNRAVREYGLTEPGLILDKAREIVIQEFEKSEEDVNDGMDIALCSLKDNILKYAGAHNPLWIIRKNSKTIEVIKANKEPIGKFARMTPYRTTTIELNSGDSIYLFSDGYVDQFGGEKGKKFKSSNFKNLLLSIQDKSMDQQKRIIDSTFEKWRGDLEQIDDVCVLGFKA